MAIQKLVALLNMVTLGALSQIEFDPDLRLPGGTRIAPTQVDVEGPVEYTIIEDPLDLSFGNVFFYNPTNADLADIRASITYQHTTELRKDQALESVAGPGIPNATLALGLDFWIAVPGVPLSVAPNLVPYVPLINQLSAAGVITVGAPSGRFIIEESGVYRVTCHLTSQSTGSEALARLGLVVDPDNVGGGTAFLEDQADTLPGAADPAGPVSQSFQHVMTIDAAAIEANRTFEVQAPYSETGTRSTGYPGQATPLAGTLQIERLS